MVRGAYEARKDERFVKWFKAALQDALAGQTLQVRIAHLRLCLGGDLDAILSWYAHHGVVDSGPSQSSLSGRLDERQTIEIRRLLKET